MATRLTGPAIGDLRALLKAAFTRSGFEDLLLVRLDRELDDYVAPADTFQTALRKVIDAANRELWWRDLVVQARFAVPADPDLLDFAQRYDLAPRVVSADAAGELTGGQLQLKINSAQSTHDISTWRARLGEIEGRVCRIEYPPTVAVATGFLVGPSALLTNFHVVAPVLDGRVAPSQVAARFDYKVGADGVGVGSGVVHALADDWLIDSSPSSEVDVLADPHPDPDVDLLDYALLRLAGTPGAEPVGGPTAAGQVSERGWISLPTAGYDFAEATALYIVQHPRGQPMQVALDSNGIVGLNGNGTRVRYTTTTLPGSSGSPCFGPDWQPVAIHHLGDPAFRTGQRATFNQGIPLAAIRRLLLSRGAAAELG